MKFQNLSVKRLFGRVAMELVLSMSGITIALFLVTKQIAVLLTGGALLLCAIVGIFVLTQAFGKRLSQFTTDLCQTLDHMIAGNEAPQRPEDSETQLARIGHRLARLYQIMQENRRRVDEEKPIDSYSYDKGVFADIRSAKQLNGWKVVDDWTPTVKGNTRKGFVHVPMLVADRAGASLSFSFEGRAVGIFCAAGPQACVLEYSVDGAPLRECRTIIYAIA